MPPTEKAEHKFDPTKLKAGREQLEAELQRRIIAKLDSGEAVLMPPRILGAPEPERPRPIPKDAKGREIYGGTRTKEGGIDFIDAIITGVPRTGRDVPDEPRAAPSIPSPTTHPPRGDQPERADARRGGEALRLSEELRGPPQPRPTPQPMPEPRYVYAEIHPAFGNDPGAIREGRYAASDGLVRVWDMQGKLLGTQAFKTGDDPARVARKVLREKRGTGFYDPLPYPRDRLV